MQAIRVIAQIAILFVFSFIGDFIVTIFNLKLPGSIIGLLLLWICLYFKWIDSRFVRDGANLLIAYLTLLFIPSTVGIIQYPELLSVKGLLLIAAVFLSSAFAFIFTGKLCQYLERMESKGEVQK